MHYTGPVYRHPLEAHTLLLQVTSGCSHNKCTFCTMYQDTPFEIDSIAQIESDLKEARQNYSHLDRIFLENADPFVLSTEKLIKIGELILSYFPEMKTISTYSSINNLKNKSVEDLKALKKLRFNDIYIGIESGYTPALELMNKGYTSDDAYAQLKKINESEIDFMALLILGIAGKGNSEINATETAKLLNQTQPKMISVIPMGIFPGSKLEEKSLNDEYVLPTELEVVQEEKLLLQLLDVENCLFYGEHANNLIRVRGMLNKDKEEMLNFIDDAIETIGLDTLNRTYTRSSI